MSKIIKLTGLASQTSKTFSVLDCDFNKNLLTFLREKHIPVASSCDGKGMCQKCVYNNDELACQTILKDICNSEITEIEISYL